jgi:transmembrane protein TMEM260 (protein O-mannosyltransferase)
VSRHRIVAAGVGVAAVVVYLLTLYPGVGGGGDAVKFQYIGSVLGTPHPPGYPLYVIVSYLFSLLPIGSLAYRINLLSAVCGAGASAIVCLTLLRLRCHVVVAVTAALGLAFDRWLWGRAVGAEVYALNAALVASMLWLAVRWRDTGRDRDLYLMVGAFALSLGNHLTVVSLLPALAAFVLMTRRASVSIRTVSISAGICVLGLAQYGFIMLRTYQGATHLEASARTFGELYQVMRATRYADQIFAFSIRELLTERVPQFWHMFVAELTPAGFALFLIGMLAGLRRQANLVVLFAGSAFGIVLLTLNVGADVDGFLVAACVPAWLLVGAGLEALWPAVSRARPRLLAGAAAAVVFALPVWQLVRNYSVNDHHRRTYEARYLRALFARLEPKAAIVIEAYPVDQLVLYKLVGEKAAGARSIVMTSRERADVARLAADGYAVYAFSTGRHELELRGFAFEPIALRNPEGAAGDAAIDMTPLPIYRVLRASVCEDVGNVGWRDITALASDGRLMVRVDNYRPFDSTVELLVGGAAASAVPEVVIAQGPARPVIGAASGASAQDRPSDVRLDDVSDLSRIDLRVNDRGDSVVSWLAWPAPPRLLWAKAIVDLNNPRRAVLCNWSRADFLAGDRTAAIPLSEEGDAFFGQGWMASEPINEGGEMRRTSEKTAEVLVPLAAPQRIRIRFHGRALGTVEAHPVTLAINGRTLPAQRITHVWTTFEWDAPAELWRNGLNRLTFESGDPAFPVGLAISRLTFERVD